MVPTQTEGLVARVDQGENIKGRSWIRRHRTREVVLRAIIGALPNAARGLEKLDLSGCGANDADVADLFSALRASPSRTTLHCLVLAHNQITDAGAVEVANFIAQTPSVKKLRLGRNAITDAGVSALVAAMGTLVELNMDETINFGGGCVCILADALKRNTSLRVLELSACGIDDAGAHALAAALCENTTLQELNVGHNDFGDYGVRVIAKASSRLRVLKVDTSSVYGQRGVSAIAELVVTSPRLETLHLYVDSNTLATIAEALPRSQRLAHLRMYIDGGSIEDVRTVAESVRRCFHIRSVSIEPTAVSQRAVDAAVDACGVYRKMVAFMSGVGAVTPLGRFLARDGDNAIMHRAVGVLVGV